MIEVKLYDYLRAKITAPVVMELPESYTGGETVLIQKTGSSMQDRIEKSVFAIQSYGDSLYKAAELNEKVKDALLSGDSTEFTARLNSDYEFNDTTRKRYRYQAVFEITSIGGR